MILRRIITPMHVKHAGKIHAAVENHARRTSERLSSFSNHSKEEREPHPRTLQDLAGDAKMNQRESKVISLRYPSQGMSLTLKEVGKALGVCAQRAGQIEHDAIRKLRRAAGTLWNPVRRPPRPQRKAKPQPSHAELQGLILKGRQAEDRARQREGEERKRGLVQAARLYRRGGLTHLADDIATEAIG